MALNNILYAYSKDITGKRFTLAMQYNSYEDSNKVVYTTYKFSIALCSKEDNFSRKIGIAKSTEFLKRSKCKFTVTKGLITFNQHTNLLHKTIDELSKLDLKKYLKEIRK